jgi:hypothetical protein
MAKESFALTGKMTSQEEGGKSLQLVGGGPTERTYHPRRAAGAMSTDPRV